MVGLLLIRNTYKDDRDLGSHFDGFVLMSGDGGVDWSLVKQCRTEEEAEWSCYFSILELPWKSIDYSCPSRRNGHTHPASRSMK